MRDAGACVHGCGSGLTSGAWRATADRIRYPTQAHVDDTGVTLQARGGAQLRARTVIAADGVHSVIAKRLGLNARWPRTQLAIDMMEETPHTTLRAGTA